jgi:hypothetical protein
MQSTGLRRREVIVCAVLGVARVFDPSRLVSRDGHLYLGQTDTSYSTPKACRGVWGELPAPTCGNAMKGPGRGGGRGVSRSV